MNEKILAALKKLDPKNDNQWTSDGLPKLESLKFHVGDSVTREQVNAVAPSFTRSNPVVEKQDNGTSSESVKSEPLPPKSEPINVEEKASEIAASDEDKSEDSQEGSTEHVVSKVVATVSIGVSDVVKTFLSNLEFVDVKTLSDEELKELHDIHSDTLSADNQVLSQLSEVIHKRAIYFAQVEEEFSKRVPGMSTADQLKAFHAQVAKTAASMPVNRPRQSVSRPPQFFRK